jgi:CDP-diacylglycerol--serine O-phosphatidyltransferase
MTEQMPPGDRGGSAAQGQSPNGSKAGVTGAVPADQVAETSGGVAEGIDTDILASVTFEVVEKGLEDGKKVSRRGVYLLPNLFTTGALFGGFYAIVAGLNGNFEAAALALFLAIFLDGLDGRVARLTNTQSAFGAEYDSLSDLVAFGVAPALMMYNWALSDTGKFGWMAAFVYLACTALRLARFNVQASTVDKRFFVGLPSPAGAGLMASFVWVGFEQGWQADVVGYVAGLFTLAIGSLMVCNLKYYSFKDLDFRGRVPFAMILVIVMVMGVVFLDPPKVILSALGVYALSGLLISFRRWLRRRGRAQTS